jgi:hypothetical protein
VELSNGYVQYLVHGPMNFPVFDPPAAALSDAHLRFLGVSLPDFVQEPVVNATVFVDAQKKGELHYGDPAFSSLVFLLQSISIEATEAGTQIIVTAVWDQTHKDMTVADKQWLAQWSVSCHMVVIGKPKKVGAKSSRASRGSKGAQAPGSKAKQGRAQVVAIR